MYLLCEIKKHTIKTDVHITGIFPHVYAGNSSLPKYNVDRKDQTILSYISSIYTYALIFLFISEILRSNLTKMSKQC